MSRADYLKAVWAEIEDARWTTREAQEAHDTINACFLQGRPVEDAARYAEMSVDHLREYYRARGEL